MRDNIIQTITEIIEFLESCNQKGWAAKYERWREKIIKHKNDPEILESIYKELYAASAPRGWLGDYPITSAIKGKYNYEAIEIRRRDLVEKIISQLEDEGIKI
jgi:hypothetical protein